MAAGDAPPAGHNNPPAPTPYEAAAAAVAEVRGEALQWLDGAPVADQAQADGLALLLDMTRKASKLADDARKDEARPFDDGKAAVQARYKPLLADAERVADALKAALAKWLARVADEQRAAAEAARIEADAKAAQARAAWAAANPDNLAEREAAEAAIIEAGRAERDAVRAANATATAKAVTGARAVGLRSYWNADLHDPVAFARWLWTHRRADYDAWLATVAQREIAAAKHDLPGVRAVEDRRAA